MTTATRTRSSDTSTLTWTLSGFGDEIDENPDVQTAVLSSLGARHIEVRGAWGTNIVDLDEAQLGELAAVFRRRGFSVSAIASPIGKVPVSDPAADEVARLERAVRAAEVLGSQYIRIFSFYPAEGQDPDDIRDDVMERMRALADVAERAGVTLLHENEKEIFGDIPRRVLDIVETVASPNLRLAWDNANFVQCGVKPFTEAWPMLNEYVDYLQVKDAVAATGQVVPAGLGDGELLETVTALRDRGYDGFASLEPHLADTNALGGFSGPAEFGRAARAFAALTDRIGVTTA